jgi:hypothetical protein
LAAAAGVVLAHLLARVHRRGRREAPAWNGGYLPPPATSQYTGLGYAGPVRTLVKGALGVSSAVVALNGDDAVHPLAHLPPAPPAPDVEAAAWTGEIGLPEGRSASLAHRYSLRALQEDLFYRPGLRAVLALSHRFQALHTGNLGTYLLWLLLALLAVLVLVALKI